MNRGVRKWEECFKRSILRRRLVNIIEILFLIALEGIRMSWEVSRRWENRDSKYR